MGVDLYKHNKVAFEKVETMLKTKDKACIVHATGTGKSFIALKLIYDFIMENPDS
jgi:superfamily II DNA or RNA helicase